MGIPYKTGAHETPMNIRANIQPNSMHARRNKAHADNAPNSCSHHLFTHPTPLSSASLADLGGSCPACICPITQDVMEDPVVCADGHSYERAAITQWLLARDTSPCTNAPLLHKNVVPNHACAT